MKITPLAADSMGVRSSATLVETGEHRILMDPGAALAPVRFELPPARVEEDTLKHFRTVICSEAKDCDTIIISHYHHDHFDPEADYYRGKRLFVKSWMGDINHSQHERALKLAARFERLGILPAVTPCDGIREVLDDGLELTFSTPVPHGPVGTGIGYVIMTTIFDGRFRFMHCSDVQGPVEPSTAKSIIDSGPDLVYIDGPPTHLLGIHFREADLEKAINNISDIITTTSASIILDHHLMRDRMYRDLMGPVYDHGNRVMSASEYLGLPNNLLEATRDELWDSAGD